MGQQLFVSRLLIVVDGGRGCKGAIGGCLEQLCKASNSVFG